MAQFDPSDAECTTIEPIMPMDVLGKERAAPWVNIPGGYGAPHTTCRNTLWRCRKRGIWDRLLIDFSVVKAHRCAAGSRGAHISGHRPFPEQVRSQDSCAHRPVLPPAHLLAYERIGRGLQGRSLTHQALAPVPHRARRQRLRQRRYPAADRGDGSRSQHPTEIQLGSGSRVSRRASTRASNPSSACSATSRTFVALSRDPTG